MILDTILNNFLTREIKKQKFYKNLGSWFANSCATILLKKPKDIYLSPYKIFNAEIVSEIIKYAGPYPYLDGLIFRVTNKIKQINVDHSERYAGKGNYTLRKSTKVWANLATNFSILPLRLSTIFGFLAAISGFLLGGFYIVSFECCKSQFQNVETHHSVYIVMALFPLDSPQRVSMMSQCHLVVLDYIGWSFRI